MPKTHSGVATPVDGGFRVNGQWSFASGCQHGDWFVAHCMVDDGVLSGCTDHVP